ncbi:hypothetical protein, partial [Enterococcus faecalis]|uniref:hypothetical protein n=1 Tax=Enterococcus faecalis TaxID=1351 RepID=UPI00403A9CD4
VRRGKRLSLARGGGGIPGEALSAGPDLALAGNAADGLNSGKGSAVNSASRGASSALLEVGGSVDALEAGLGSSDGASGVGGRAETASGEGTAGAGAGSGRRIEVVLADVGSVAELSGGAGVDVVGAVGAGNEALLALGIVSAEAGLAKLVEDSLSIGLAEAIGKTVSAESSETSAGLADGGERVG